MTKDANDLLVANRIKAIQTMIYEARAWRPGGIMNATEIWDDMLVDSVAGRPLPFSFMNGMEDGIGGGYPGTITTWVAGSGMGKSTAVREIAFAALKDGKVVGDVRLEERYTKTGWFYVGLEMNQRLHAGQFDKNSPEVLQARDATLGTGRLFLFNHFGSLDGGDLLSKLRFMVVACGVQVLIIDHISIVVSDVTAQTGARDERTAIDTLMTQLRSLAEQTGVEMHIVCHLRRVANGQETHEEGGKVSLADLRGSQSIAQLSDNVVALERNQQGEGDTETTNVRTGEIVTVSTKNVAAWRSLKARETGFTGKMGTTYYDRKTGRMVEVTIKENDGDAAGHAFTPVGVVPF